MAGGYLKHNKHIVWIVPGFARNDEDDTCMPYLQELLNYIKANSQLTITILALHYPYTRDEYDLMGSKVYPLNGQNKWINKPEVWMRAQRHLNRIHQNSPIDVLHSFWFGETTIIGESFAKKHQIKHITQLMGQDALPNNRHLKNSRLKQVPVIAISNVQALNFKLNTNRIPIDIIPFGLNPIKIPLVDKKFDVIGVGSLVPVKNYTLWIEVIERMVVSKPYLSSLIVGSGPEFSKLQTLIQNKGLTQHVEILQHQSRASVLQLMNQSKMFMHTAKYEGLGYVFMEALRAGLPIISTPVGYAAENENIWKGQHAEELATKALDILNSNLKITQPTFVHTEETFSRMTKVYFS